MRPIIGVWVGLILLASAAGADAQDVDQAERAVMKEVLKTTFLHLEPKVKGDPQAMTELKKLKEPTDKDLDRMAADVKVKFKLEKLTLVGHEKIKPQIEKAIKEADADDLKKALRNRDSKVVPKLCFIWGCE